MLGFNPFHQQPIPTDFERTLPISKLKSQRERILASLLQGDHLTGIGAIGWPLRCAHLASRISELRSEGHDIRNRKVTRGGAEVKLYYMEPAPQGGAEPPTESSGQAGGER